MTAPVMEVSGITKIFRTYRRELQRVATWFGLSPKPAEEFVVLRDISFGMMPGQAIGIVGQNGAGKSTLLKIITGTLVPTHGRIMVNGHISALLELGLGFNPEFTARQNVYHSGGLMGFSQKQIAGFMPEVEAFAQIGDYFDEPMRTYSSGMQMRVAFSLATAVRPDVLIVDEALSVGDAYFQHKSFERIRRFREQGTSLLFVSHDKSAVQSLCDRAILLEKGEAVKDGDPEEIMDFYNAMIAMKENTTVEVRELDCGKKQTVSGTGQAKVQSIGLYNSKGEPAEHIGVGEHVELRIKVKVFDDLESLVLGYAIKDRLGQVMYGTNTWHTGQAIQNPVQNDVYNFTISFPANLGVGSYAITTALTDRDSHITANYEWIDLAMIFDVINFDKVQFTGSSWIEPIIEVNQV
ncbi:lipopolysaccharide transport system ATP-binding protein [Desulfosalsimonas propionicica]|uniref:Lipopolysaccharide transport system ATP-binding protein n=1 Tax=Desulfosalsimonas propionicica TaxID=332175 RepID=A0A7W0C6B6_9BACT|nr:ABC transporter ATP-binding protein [Desulfosalsimonas propionicica]MBA2880004.1 lipopolysaccharide transport system ATP-binding protein [Desulfosalsimonas propionicica]